MKKLLRVFWCILTVIGIIIVMSTVKHMIFGTKCDFAVRTCVSEKTAVRVADAVILKGAQGEFDTEDVGMQIVYQLAKRSIVKVVVKDFAGSGIIWKHEDGIVIVSNRHLLMNDVKADIHFGNGKTISADVIGYSQQYDIGFVKIAADQAADNILRDIFEAVPVLYETESEAARAEFVQQYSGKRVLQVGAAIDKKTANVSTGNIKGLSFVPLFNTNVLETACFSRAGMSGGGVFDENGRFLGMISGGEVPEGAEMREAKITYSIPPVLIASELETILEEKE